MLHRRLKEELLCITQPHHAWVSGQLARAWGNKQFGQFFPTEDVCIAAEQHDIGWSLWEKNPTLNPQTGYPRNFLQLPTAVHVGIWSSAQQLTPPLGRYVALLISLHGTGLYERYRGWENSLEIAPLVKDFLAREYSFQERLKAELRNDADYAPYATPEVIGRNRQLIVVWDALSLVLCHGVKGEQLIENVPAARGETTLKLTALEENPLCVKVSPWPFQEGEVSLICKGRLLSERFNDEAAMQEALNYASWVTIEIVLIPGTEVFDLV